MYVGIIGGLFNDYFGGKWTCAVGAALTSLGYFLAWANTKSILGDPKPAVIAAAFVLAWQGASWLDCAAISLTVRNFPRNKGLLIGLVKTFFGLSGAILGQFYVGFHLKDGSSTFGTDDSIPFLLFLSLIILASAILVTPFMNKSPQTTPASPKGERAIRYGYVVVMVLAAFLSAAGLSEKLGAGVGTPVKIVFSVVTVLLIVALMAIVPISGWGDAAYAPLAGERDEMMAPIMTTTTKEGTKPSVLHAGADDDDDNGSAEDTSSTLVEAVCTPEFYLLAFAAFAHTGTGLMIINNIAQIAESIQGHKDDSVGSLFVILIGTLNAYGRMAGGFFSDYFSKDVSRPAILSSALIAMAIGSVVFAFATYELLFLAAPLCAFAYGCYWSTSPAIVGDMFGTKSYGAIYSVLSIGTASGGFALNAGLATYFYDKHAETVQSSDDDDSTNKCYGTICYKPTFLICAALCIVGAVGLLVLAKRIGKGRYRYI